MVVYKKKASRTFRYAFAIVVFTLGLTLTVVDVYGLQMPFGQNADNSYSNYLNKKIETTNDDSHETGTINLRTETNDNQGSGTETIPTSVPEPSTIILLASGLGLLRLAKRKNI